MAGVYLYAVLDGSRQPDLGDIGLPDGGRRVETITSGGLSAVVGDHHGPALVELPKAHVLRCLAIHQRVIERAMKDHRVLPAKFGTVLSSRDQVRALLTGFQHRLRSAFLRLGDAIEVEVAATWDLKRTLAEIGQEAGIAEAAASANGLPADQCLAMRIQVGRLVKESLDHRREGYQLRVLRELVPSAIDAQPNAIVSDELVINVAFLIKRTGLEHFYEAVHRLDAAFDGQLLFRCVGPLPPYSFGTIEVVRPSAVEIEEARRLLELGEQASEREVNAAYRRLAAREHPDHNPGQNAAAERFAALGRAQAQLKAFIVGQRTVDERDAEERQCELTRAAVEGTQLLAVRRSALPPIDITTAFDTLEPSYERDTVAV